MMKYLLNLKASNNKVRAFVLVISGALASIGRWDSEYFPKTIIVFGVGLCALTTFYLCHSKCVLLLRKFMLWYGLFFFIVFISWMYTPNDIDAIIMVRRCLFVFIVTAISMQNMEKMNDFIYLLYGIIVGALVTLIAGVIAGVNSQLGIGRMGGVVCGSAPAYASVLFLGFISSLILDRIIRNRALKILSIALFAGIALSGSRLQFIACFPVVLIFYYYVDLDIFRRMVRILIGVLIIIISMYSVYKIQYIHDLIGYRIESMIQTYNTRELEADNSISERIQMQREAIRLWLDSPIYGNGVNSFWVLSRVTNGRATSHSGILEILCSYGIIGFVLFYRPHLEIIVNYIKRKGRMSVMEKILSSLVILILFTDWQTTSFQSGTTICFLAATFNILGNPNKYGLNMYD